MSVFSDSIGASNGCQCGRYVVWGRQSPPWHCQFHPMRATPFLPKTRQFSLMYPPRRWIPVQRERSLGKCCNMACRINMRERLTFSQSGSHRAFLWSCRPIPNRSRSPAGHQQVPRNALKHSSCQSAHDRQQKREVDSSQRYWGSKEYFASYMTPSCLIKLFSRNKVYRQGFFGTIQNSNCSLTQQGGITSIQPLQAWIDTTYVKGQRQHNKQMGIMSV